MTPMPIMLMVGQAEVPDPDLLDDDPAATCDVPALFVAGVAEPIWVAPANTYWDQWGDGGTMSVEVVADHLRKVLG